MKLLKRGQGGTEAVIFLVVVFILLIPIIYYALTQSDKSIKVSQLDSTVTRLANVADSIGTLGPGSSEIVVITIPTGAESITIENKTIRLKITGFGDVVAFTKVNVFGNISLEPGTYYIPVTVMNNTDVRIGEALPDDGGGAGGGADS